MKTIPQRYLPHFFMLVIVAIGVAALSQIQVLRPSTGESPLVNNTESTKYSSDIGYEAAIIDAVEKVSPAIVSITVSKNVPILENCSVSSPFDSLPPEFRQFFGGDFRITQPCQKGTRMQDIGGGSGFIVSQDGMIVTNKHVVSDTEASYTVFTNDGKKYAAKVLARDPLQDVAIVKIDAVALPVVTLGDSDGIRLGQTAVAIGNALGEFRNTVSVGIVSGLARTVTASSQRGFDTETLEGVIQTDAAINPGNSGGPLINLKGEVIGINTAVVSGANNIGFSIPINNVKRDIASVKKNGTIVTPFLGVRYVMLNEEIAKKEELEVAEGALVRGSEEGPAVARNSPAAKAGILAEDIIVAVGGVPVGKDHSLVSLIQRYNVGDVVALKVLRGKDSFIVKVTLEERT